MKGWFTMPGRDGDRTIEQQLLGLDWLLANCAGKSILDAGCAEGLISKALLDAGARRVHGVELREDAVKVACKVCAPHGMLANFTCADLNGWRPPLGGYDIVIGLAILHKVRDPSALALRLAMAAKSHVVFRLPPATAPVVVDARSGNKPHDIELVMDRLDFELVQATCDGPFGEWVGRWERAA